MLVMAALAVRAVTAALLHDRADIQAPPPADPRHDPADRAEITRLLATPPPARPGHAEHWSTWRRQHQARSRWYHQRTWLARDTEMALVS